MVIFAEKQKLMKTMKRMACVAIITLLAVSVQAQLGQAVRQIFTADGAEAQRRDSDSLRVASLRKSLEEARLNEANLRMEMDLMRLRAATADSAQRAVQRARMDSLRRSTKGVPVVVEGDTLFCLFAKRGGYTPVQRA